MMADLQAGAMCHGPEFGPNAGSEAAGVPADAAGAAGRPVPLSDHRSGTDLAGDAGRSLVERCRRRLARDGACVLENLLQPPVAEAAWPEVMP